MQEIPVRNFQGLNLRDAADKVKDNEFTKLQNVYQATKGVLARRFGSIVDQTSGFDLASRISGVWRHYGANGDRVTLYHCVPDATLLPDNTTDLTLTDLNDGLGDLFSGGAVVTLRVCYSWIGRGLEQTYNSRNRAGFPASGSFPLSASANPAHQTITLGGNTHSLQVAVPAFPSGVTGANIFVARGASTEMCYVGSITTSAGNLIVRETIAGTAVKPDGMAGTDAQPVISTTGALKPGVYYVSLAWLCDHAGQEGASHNHELSVVSEITVSLSGENNAIFVLGPQANSANGGRAAYVFIGTQPGKFMPQTCVGILRSNPASSFNFMTITSIPSHNGATSPYFQGPDTNGVYFRNSVNSCDIGSANDARFPGFKLTETTQFRYQARFGFILAKSAGGSIREIFPSRTWQNEFKGGIDQRIFAGDQVSNWALGFPINYHNYASNPKTQNDTFRLVSAVTTWVNPFPYARTPIDPNFCYQNGVSYMANGSDIPWVIDGYSMCQLTPVAAASQTVLPPPPKFLLVYQSSLVAFGAANDNLLYQSNANNPQNWAVGGTGPSIRFATIGDATGSGGTALGIFTPQTEATSNPSSFLIGFKKNGTWMIPTIPDPSANTAAGAQLAFTGGPLQQVSGRVGCTAYRSIAQTPIGTLFVGQDGNVYRINAVREPQRLGGKIQNALSHLVGNDTLMRLVTAVYHDNHYKVSYPSATTSTKNDAELWADLRTDEGDPIVWVGPHIGRNIGPQIVLVGENDDLSRLYADGAVIRTVTADSITTYADLAANGSAQAIAVAIKSKIYRFSTESHIKRIQGAVLDMYLDFSFTNNVLFEGWADSYYQQVNRQLSVAGGVWDASLFDQSFFADSEWMGFSFLFGPDNLIGRTFQWQISSSDQAPLILSAVLMQLKAEKRTIVG